MILAWPLFHATHIPARPLQISTAVAIALAVAIIRPKIE